MEKSFYQGMLANPDDLGPRLIFADWLEENGDSRGELTRLTHLLTQHPVLPDRKNHEARLRQLLNAGTKPIGPRWTNSIGMQFAWVSPGLFVMGSPPDEADRLDDEMQHPVTITQGFYLGVQPVTQGQWQAILGKNPSRFQGVDRPVECVSWEDCQQFCQALRQADGLLTGLPSPYRLPTEAEWEYACRGGTSSPYFFGSKLDLSQAKFHTPFNLSGGVQNQPRQETTPVGQFPGNTWGLEDLHGNVYEWCGDYYGALGVEAVQDPMGPSAGNTRILRGGSWHSLPSRCRSSCRGWGAPAYRGSDVGFRVCFRMDYCYAI